MMADARLVMTLRLDPARGRHIFRTEQRLSGREPASFQNLLADFPASICTGHWGHVHQGGQEGSLGSGSWTAEAMPAPGPAWLALLG